MSLKERIASESDYIRVVCNRIATVFKNPPRLKVFRSEEEAAARKLYRAGYKASFLLAIMEWVSTNAEWDGWRERITSVSALAQALLTPKDISNCLETQYEAWKVANPPVCPHGILLTLLCLRCSADPKCKKCGGTGSTVAKIWIERLHGMYLKQFFCECCGKGSVEEQIAQAEKQENAQST